MRTLDRDFAPPSIPTGPVDWQLLEGEFTHPIEPFPKEHLVGKRILEDTVASAEAKWEAGQPLSKTEIELLQLAQETAPDDSEYRP